MAREVIRFMVWALLQNKQNSHCEEPRRVRGDEAIPYFVSFLRLPRFARNDKNIFCHSVVWCLVSGVCCLTLASCRPLYKNTFVIAGTYLEVSSPDRRAAGIVHDEFKRLDKIFNFYDSKSEISRLNQTDNTPFKASPELIELLGLAVGAYKMTGGAFDVSCGRLYEFWKALLKEEGVDRLPSQLELDELKDYCGMNYIAIDEARGTITIKQKGLKIDLAGLAKGYLVDRAVQKLKAAGIDSALINAGGDIYCLGQKGGQPWRVGLRDPQELDGVLDQQDLQDEAVATSGSYEQFFEYQGKRYSHLIDPRTGWPVENEVVSATVITKNCTTADMLATAFFVLGPEGVREFLAKTPSTMRIFLVTQDEEGRRIQIFQ